MQTKIRLNNRISGSLFLMCAFLLTGCLKDQCDRTHEFIRYDPVYKTADGMRVNVSVEPARELKSPGNFYYYNGYLLVNERLEGVHVIDNHDPANPVNLAFISIPGNRDIAVRNNLLYADMFIDLVTIDITNIQNPTLVCRVENVFDEFFVNAGDLGYIVDYIPTPDVQHVDCSDYRWNNWWWRGTDDVLWLSSSAVNSNEFLFDATSSFSGQNSGQSNAPSGTGGSMARFTLAKEHLYTLDVSRMHVFNLQATCPEQKNTVDMRWGIETLFPYGDYLFVGSNNGMLIYNNANAELPEYLSEFSHAQACDPVFVSDDIAYVTLRDGTNCNNFINQLDVIDVSSISNPKLIRTFQMQHPHGLSVTGNTLFLCEGAHGLKVFDVSDKENITNHLLRHMDGIHAFDVIILPQISLAMVVGEDGVYQYDVSNREEPVLLSTIRINR